MEIIIKVLIILKIRSNQNERLILLTINLSRDDTSMSDSAKAIVPFIAFLDSALLFAVQFPAVLRVTTDLFPDPPRKI